jgi:hypothetical protein
MHFLVLLCGLIRKLTIYLPSRADLNFGPRWHPLIVFFLGLLLTFTPKEHFRTLSNLDCVAGLSNGLHQKVGIGGIHPVDQVIHIVIFLWCSAVLISKCPP